MLWGGLGSLCDAAVGLSPLRVGHREGLCSEDMAGDSGWDWAGILPSRMEPKLFILIVKTLSISSPAPRPSSPPTRFSRPRPLLHLHSLKHSADSVSTLLAPSLGLHGAPCQAHPAPTAHPLSKSSHCETREATCELELKDKEGLITGRALGGVRKRAPQGQKHRERARGAGGGAGRSAGAEWGVGRR